MDSCRASHHSTDVTLGRHHALLASIPAKIEPKLEPPDQAPGATPDPDPDDHLLLSEYFLPAAQRCATKGGSEAATSTAIVPAPWAGKKRARSGELVRAFEPTELDRVKSRNWVRRIRMAYESIRHFLARADEERPREPGRRSRVDLRAASLMYALWLHRDRRVVGALPGLRVGDVFLYRVELCVVGLHGHVQAGIDYVPARQSEFREPVATSVVFSGAYEDDEDRGDVILYTGHGGRKRNAVAHSLHQRLAGGNLALERSRCYGIEVRVVRGLKHERSPTGKLYVYDGLYKVVDCWGDVGKSGYSVYKYKLVRLDGQEPMGSAAIKRAEDLKHKLSRSIMPAGYLSVDISNGKEKQPVSLFNDIDGEREPLVFDYLVRPVFPSFVAKGRSQRNACGCRCVYECTVDCECAAKNGGEFAYDKNGILLRGKPVIYECGAACQCPPSCMNRVSQHGVRHRLEVFRSKETGWGVRSLDLITAGEFVCEFSGIVLSNKQLEVANASNLVYPSRFPRRWEEWGNVSSIIEDYRPPDFPYLPELSFAIVTSKIRNVACYFSHSSSPNLFVQFVLFGHNNESYPHVMIFAMENIPPFRELSIDYGEGMISGQPCVL